MPPKAHKKVMLGKSLIRQKNKITGNITSRSQIHTMGAPDKKEGLLESITEQSNLADFMTRVNISERLFEARTELLTTDTAIGVLTAEQKTEISRVQVKHAKDLRIPRRPYWDENTTADELHESESDAFAKWRMRLSKLSNIANLTVTPYEKNPHVWRQLWRVVERSDVVVQIVDARNPLLFRCTDLENYVNEVGDVKVNLLLVNKSDFLTEEQRQTWTNYFNDHGIYAVFFSALDSTKELDEKEGLVAPGQRLPDIDENEAEEGPYEDSEESFLEEETEENSENNDDLLQDTQQDKNSRLSEYVHDAAYNSNKINNKVIGPSGVQNEAQSSPTSQLVDDSDDCSSDYEDALSSDDSSANEGENDDSLNDSHVTNDALVNSLPDEEEESSQLKNSSACQSGLTTSSRLYNREELIALLSHLAPQRQLLQTHTTVGLVGYPNVGKSSTINCLMADKKVTVSATPGKTKHFQTHHLSLELVLCDCPGLVFPGFVSTKQEMILWGILPIDRMRDYSSAVSVLCRTLPPEALEATYSIPLPAGDTRPPTDEEFLSAISLTRSFMSARGRADTSRAARAVLKDFMNGRLLHCIAPPDVPQDAYHRLQQDLKTKKRVQLTPQQKTFMPETESDVDAHLDFILGINTEDEAPSKGSKPRKQRIKKPKGLVEMRETENGPELVITKPWKNRDRARRQGKKNPNTNNPYDDVPW